MIEMWKSNTQKRKIICVEFNKRNKEIFIKHKNERGSFHCGLLNKPLGGAEKGAKKKL